MLGIGGEEPAVPRLRDVAGETGSYGDGSPEMTCPLQTKETDLLLDYSAGRLDAARTAALAQHMDNCPVCTSFRTEQTAVWDALDLWEPAPPSIDFNRRLWQRIESSAAAPWYRNLLD